MAKQDTPREPRRIKSIEVGFRILRLLEQAGEKLPLRDIAAGVDMPASNAYLYLASFVYEGIAEQDPVTSRYGLGPFAVQLGSAALRQSSLIERAKDLLTRLRDMTHNSVFLAVWGNRGPTVVFQIDGAQYGPMGIRVGNVLPLLSTSTGRVFLSWLPTDHTRLLIEHERAASLSLAGSFDARIRNAGVDDIVHSVRSLGMAQTDPSMSGGFAAAAAPVFDQEGKICAVVTTIGPERREAGAMDEIGKKLREAAGELSKRLGGRPSGLVP